MNQTQPAFPTLKTALVDNGFSGRIEKASKFEQELFDRIERLGFCVAMNGTEHTYPEFVDRLRKSTDQTSLAIRFQPDAVASIGKIPRSFFVEAKAAHTMERLAWEQYWRLYCNGNILVLVFEDFDWAWNFIEEIRLIPGEETVSSFPPKMRFPVVDGWITPRGSRRWRQLRNKIKRASFTPYRKVDGSSLRPWSEFRDGIIGRLEELGCIAA
jgi:hypothetical protein